MDRMCKMMTLACATALVAGSVASAADKSATEVAVSKQVIAPGSARQAVTVINNSNLWAVGGVGCDCTWFNGAFDGRDGQVSHLGGAVPHGAKAADDFYLCEGNVYDLSSISATLFTTTTAGVFVKAKLEIYADCNGCPGQLLYTLEKGTPTDFGPTASSFGLAFDGRPLRRVDWKFDLANEVKTENKNIVLKGGVYWISIYGLSDNLGPTMQMYDVTYWGTTGNGVIKGSVAKKIDGLPTTSWTQFNFPSNGWITVEDCCVGCTDLNFTVCATPCKILVDNGEGRRQIASEAVGSTSQFAPTSWSAAETRSADDFVAPPCDDWRICYVEGCVLTNCVGFKGAFEIYGNDCKKPDFTLPGTPLFGQVEATKIIDLGYTARLDNKVVKAYKLEFHDITGITLTGGRQYWISIGVKYTFSVNERAYFCYNSDCERSCLIRWNEGRVRTSSSLDSEALALNPTSTTIGWAKVGNDFAFLIAAEPTRVTGGNATGGTQTCQADFNRDGNVGVQDILDFVSTWLNGCVP